MPAFLRAYSGKSILPVYEVSLDAGAAAPVVTIGPPPDVSVVDRIELFDPTDPTLAVQLEFSVFPSPRTSLSEAHLEFSTRCFLTPAASDKLAPVELTLQFQGGQVLVRHFKMFGNDPSSGPALPAPVSGLGGITFVPALGDFGVAAFQTPELLARLGIATYYPVGPPFPGWYDPQLECRPGNSGVRFDLVLPMEPLVPTQSIDPYGIVFQSDDTTLPVAFDQRPSVAFTQTPDRHDPGAWVLTMSIPAGIILANWNRTVVAPYLDALNMVRNGLPLSFVPELTTVDGNAIPFAVSFSLVDNLPPTARVFTKDQCVFRDSQSALENLYLNIVTGAIQLPSGSSVTCTASFPNVVRSDAAVLQARSALLAKCVISGSPANTANDPNAPILAGYCLWFQHQFDSYSTTAVLQAAVRMGALDLQFPLESPTVPHVLPGRDPGPIQASFRPNRSKAVGNKPGDDLPGLVRLENLAIAIALAGIGAGGQDDVPGAEYAPPNQPYPRGSEASLRRAPALQIPLQDIHPIGDYFILDVNETCYEMTSQTLSLGIEQQRASISTTSVDANSGLRIVVIDPEPFLIAQISLPDYQQALLDAVTDQIFNWNNYATDASWQISAGTQAFQLTLPPQGVTEAMHKNKDQQPPDITPGAPVDFRFTPPAVLDLQASAVPQRFVEVPWNLRRVLGYPQQAMPGAVLDGATFEFVYGLSATLNAKPGLMIAEIGARLGQLASAPSATISWQSSTAQRQGYQTYKTFWEQLNPQLRTRAAALEPWSPAQPSGLTLTENDNLAFQLRKGADLAWPIANRPSAFPANIPDGSLQGSFSWAFDSQRIYQSLWANPNSVSGDLSGLAFSSLGGWGQFTARFANGKTSIIASVRMGRIQTLTIEQIGRVGNFWNRAKLVITYERTVAATRQFYRQQQPFYGNPILRKTAEYVQLLEKRRDAAATDTVGPYSACEFPHGDPPKIPVDSAWGRDVGEYGYKIPLWKPGAQPSDVYVKPSVRLHLKGTLSDDTVPHSIADPEKLCFYTTTDPNLDADTDAWPKALGADYGYVSSSWVGPTNPGTLAADAHGKAGNFKADTTTDDEAWIRPGLGAFTYSLETPSLPSNITAGVSATPIGTTVRTITIMRGVDQSALLDATTDYAKSLMIPDQVTNILRPVISQLRVGATAADLQAKWKASKDQVYRDANKSIAALTGLTLPAAPANQLKNQLAAQLSTLSTQVENGMGGLLAEAHNLLQPATAPDFTALKQTAWPSLYGVIKAQLSFTGTQITTWTDTLLNQINIAITSDPVNGVIPALNSLVAGLPGAPDPAGLAQTAALQIDAALAQTVSIVESTLLPLAAGNIDRLRQSLIVLRNNISAAAQSAILRLQNAHPDIAGAIAQITPLVATCQGTQAAMGTLIGSLKTSAAALQNTTVEKTLSLLDSALAQAADWNTFISNAAAPLAAISAGLDNTLNSQMQDLAGQIGGYANLAGPILQTTPTDILNSVTQLLNPDTIEHFFDNLTTGIDQVADAAGAVEDYLHGLESATGQFMDAIRPNLNPPQLPSALPDAAMFLLRGFGDVPAVSQLNFNQAFSAFRFAGLDPGSGLPFQLPQVNLTPLVGLANQLGDGIGNPINLAIPAFQLGDNLIPFNLSSFDFGSLIPKIAGMDLSNLFQGLRLPDSMGKNVIVTHGEDLQSRSAWVEIDVNINLADEAEVFSYFGVTLTLETANFQANTHLQGQAGQPVTRTMKGSVSGDWSLAVGGFEIVVLENCSLTFDEAGHFGFNVTPEKVKLQAILEFLSDLIADFFDGDGFTISITPEGVQTLLELPLPDIQSGTFGIANLSLMCSFGLVFTPDFEIQVGLGLASSDNPFTLTVFILGGAGYLELDAAYTPSTNQIATDLEIGIFASASLAISLGPISGGVYVYFGITVSYHAKTGQAPDLQIGLELMFIGQVSLLGFISVSLVLCLSATYDSTSHILIGTGTIHFTIKISFFFTLSVNASVSYTFSNHPVGARLPPDAYDAAAAEYLAMFSN